MKSPIVFARRVFFWAGLYGIAVIVPMYFLEGRLTHDLPPPLTHPEYYYGFLGVTLAWQVAFLIVSRDVLRYRPLMLPAVAEKFLFVVSTFVLYAGGRVTAASIPVAVVDVLLGSLFVAAYAGVGQADTGGHVSPGGQVERGAH